MGLFKTALYIIVIAVVLQFFKRPSLPVRIEGTFDPKFKAVREAFRKNFENGWEQEGAAFAVYYNGKLVVDLWGGYADSDAMREWKRDTLTTVWSSTKALAALSVAKLVDQGHLSYSDLVTKYWPEFGKHGKDNVTVEILMSHQAGLAVLDSVITHEDMLDPKRMAKHFEDAKPIWPPGRNHGYHALTFGWLADQLLRRADPKKRSLGKFFHEEILSKTGNEECYIGLPKELTHRVARMTEAGMWDVIGHMFDSITFALFQTIMTVGGIYRKITGEVGIFERIGQNAPSIFDGVRLGMNNPDTYELEIPAAGGKCTARGLAQAFNGVLQGKVLSKKTLDYISKPLIVEEKDFVMGAPMTMSQGFWFTKTPDGNYALGHPGYGGQNVRFDQKNNLAFAYVTNSLKSGMGILCRTHNRLVKALYESL